MLFLRHKDVGTPPMNEKWSKPKRKIPSQIFKTVREIYSLIRAFLKAMPHYMKALA